MGRPSKPDALQVVPVRFEPDAVAWLDTYGQRHGLTRSEALRAVVNEARQRAQPLTPCAEQVPETRELSSPPPASLHDATPVVSVPLDPVATLRQVTPTPAPVSPASTLEGTAAADAFNWHPHPKNPSAISGTMSRGNLVAGIDNTGGGRTWTWWVRALSDRKGTKRRKSKGIGGGTCDTREQAASTALQRVSAELAKG